MKNLLLAAAILLSALPAHAQRVSKGDVQRMTYDNLNSADFTAIDDISVGDDLTVTDDASVSGDLSVTGTTTLGAGLDTSGIAFGSTFGANPLTQYKVFNFAADDLDDNHVLFASEAGKQLCIFDFKAYQTGTITGPGTDDLIFEESETNNDMIKIDIGALNTAGTLVGSTTTSGVTFGSGNPTCLASGSGLRLYRVGATATGIGFFKGALIYTVN